MQSILWFGLIFRLGASRALLSLNRNQTLALACKLTEEDYR
jgi:hypothetical protein